jgi:tetratricopeptide (TPR) repeat protein
MNIDLAAKETLRNLIFSMKSKLSSKCLNLEGLIQSTHRILLSIIAAGFLTLSLTEHSFAKNEEPKKATMTLRAKVFDKLSEAQSLIENESYVEGKEILDDLYESRDRRRLNAVELAYMYNFYGFYYYSKENYKKAIESYKKVSNTQEISDAMKMQSLYTLGQLEFVQENFGKSLEYLLSWLSLAQNPSGDSYVLIGQVYYQIKNYNKAIDFVEKGISLFDAEKKEPKENWLRLQAALYFEKNDIIKTANVYERLVTLYPKKAYFTQLSSMYGELKKPLKQLSIMQAAYRAKMLNTESEVVNYAYMLLAQDLPFQAAKALEKGIEANVVNANQKNLKILGNAYYQSRDFEKSVPYLKRSANLSKESDIWMMLASSFLQLEEFNEAKQAAQQALKKENLKNPGMAYVVLGTALLNLKEFDYAEEAFKKASRYEKTRSYGTQWLSYTISEKKKHEELKAWLGS